MIKLNYENLKMTKVNKGEYIVHVYGLTTIIKKIGRCWICEGYRYPTLTEFLREFNKNGLVKMKVSYSILIGKKWGQLNKVVQNELLRSSNIDNEYDGACIIDFTNELSVLAKVVLYESGGTEIVIDENEVLYDASV